jgi:hypothetical protein
VATGRRLFQSTFAPAAGKRTVQERISGKFRPRFSVIKMADNWTNGSIAGGPMVAARGADDTDHMDALLDRIHQITAFKSQPAMRLAVQSTGQSGEALAREFFNSRAGAEHNGEWFPPEPETLAVAGLTSGEVEGLALKTLYGRRRRDGASPNSYACSFDSLIRCCTR